jgi:hypothetical protein
MRFHTQVLRTAMLFTLPWQLQNMSTGLTNMYSVIWFRLQASCSFLLWHIFYMFLGAGQVKKELLYLCYFLFWEGLSLLSKGEMGHPTRLYN